jgi:hypothetical protein
MFIVFKAGTFYCKQGLTFSGKLGAQGWDTEREPKPKKGARFGNILIYTRLGRFSEVQNRIVPEPFLKKWSEDKEVLHMRKEVV